MAKKRGDENGTVELPVGFGQVSVGDKVARIGIHISRGNITVAKADKLLCCRRLTGTIYSTPQKDAPGQTTLPGTESAHEVEGTFDVKQIGCTGKHITAGLTFSIKDVDLQELVQMAKQDGRMVIEKTEPLDGDDEEGDDEGDSEVGD